MSASKWWIALPLLTFPREMSISGLKWFGGITRERPKAPISPDQPRASAISPDQPLAVDINNHPHDHDLASSYYGPASRALRASMCLSGGDLGHKSGHKSIPSGLGRASGQQSRSQITDPHTRVSPSTGRCWVHSKMLGAGGKKQERSRA